MPARDELRLGVARVPPSTIISRISSQRAWMISQSMAARRRCAGARRRRLRSRSSPRRSTALGRALPNCSFAVLGRVVGAAQADDDVARDVVAADGQRRRVVDAAVDEDGDVGAAAADVGDDDALALLLRRRARPRRWRGAAGSARRPARRRPRRTLVTLAMALEATVMMCASTSRRWPYMPRGSRDAVLAVDDVVARHDVEDLAVGGHADDLGAVEGAGDVVVRRSGGCGPGWRRCRGCSCC